MNNKLENLNLLLITLSAVLILFNTSIQLAQNTVQEENYDWEKIVPLKTKMSEVENIYGKPILMNKYVKTYNSKQGKIQVIYNGANYTNKPVCRWNVHVNIVRRYSIFLDKPIPISKIKFDVKSFKKENTHTGDAQYLNEKKGIFFITYLTNDNQELVKLIYYNPTLCKRKTICLKKVLNEELLKRK